MEGAPLARRLAPPSTAAHGRPCPSRAQGYDAEAASFEPAHNIHRDIIDDYEKGLRDAQADMEAALGDDADDHDSEVEG